MPRDISNLCQSLNLHFHMHDIFFPQNVQNNKLFVIKCLFNYIIVLQPTETACRKQTRHPPSSLPPLHFPLSALPPLHFPLSSVPPLRLPLSSLPPLPSPPLCHHPFSHPISLTTLPPIHPLFLNNSCKI